MGESIQSSNVLGARPKTLVYGRRRNLDTTFIVAEILPEQSKQHGNRDASILPTNADISTTRQEQVPRQQQSPSEIVVKEEKHFESVTQIKPNSTISNMACAPPSKLFYCKKPRNHNIAFVLPEESKQRRNSYTLIFPTNADISTTGQQQIPRQQQPPSKVVAKEKKNVGSVTQIKPNSTQINVRGAPLKSFVHCYYKKPRNHYSTRITSILNTNADISTTQQQQVPRQQQPPSKIVAKEKKNFESVTQFKPNSTSINVRGAPLKNFVHCYFKKPRNHYSTMEDLLPQGSKQCRNRVTSILPTNADISTTQQQQVPRQQQSTSDVESVTHFKPNSTLKNLEKALSCPICMELAYKRKPTSTKCGHVFCKSCITQSLRLRAKCPTCNMPINGDMIFRIYL